MHQHHWKSHNHALDPQSHHHHIDREQQHTIFDKPKGVNDCLNRLFEAENAIALVREALTELNIVGLRSATEDARGTALSNGHAEVRTLKTCDLESIAPGTKDLVVQLGIKDEDLNKCISIFQGADTDNDGFVDVAELKKLLEDTCGKNLSEDEVRKIMRNVDVSSDGTLNFEEFLLAFWNSDMAFLENAIETIGKHERDKMEFDRLSPPERAVVIGVPKDIVVQYVRKELREANSCYQLPGAIFLFIIFFFCVVNHYPVRQLHAVDRAITWDIMENANFAFSGSVPFDNGRMGHKNINDVNTIADFWSWFDLGLVPLFWPEGWDISESRTNAYARCVSPREALRKAGWNISVLSDVPAESEFKGLCPELDEPKIPLYFFGKKNDSAEVRPPTYLMFHTILGGARLRQERTEPINCPGDEYYMDGIVRGQCHPDPGYWLQPEMHKGLKFDPDMINKPGGETKYILSYTSQTEVRQALRQLENDAWLDPTTAKVDILFTTYNAHTDVLTATFVLFFLNRGGHFHKIVEPVSTWMQPYHSFWSYILDMLFLLFIIQIFVSEGMEVFRHLRQLGFKRGLMIYTNISNLVDWVTVTYGIVLSLYWLNHTLKLRQLRDYVHEADTSIPGSWRDDEDRIAFFDLVEVIVQETHAFRMMLAVYPFVIGSRFFKAFAAQPRLGMVTKTLMFVQKDVFHFGVVFFTIFFIWSFSANILFGQELLDFANVGRSVHTTFRIMLGDFDWEAMTRVGRQQAYIWFWSFTWLVNFIMLNMLLAIIMDVYTEVKGSITDGAETLWTQGWEIFLRSREVYAGREVSLAAILKALDPTDLDDSDDVEMQSPLEANLTTDKLMGIVPKLGKEQAENLLKDSSSWYEGQLRPAESLTDATLKIARIDRFTLYLHTSMERLMHMTELTSNLLSKSSDAQRAEVRQVRPDVSELLRPQDTKLAGLSTLSTKVDSLAHSQSELLNLTRDLATRRSAFSRSRDLMPLAVPPVPGIATKQTNEGGPFRKYCGSDSVEKADGHTSIQANEPKP